MTKPAKSEAEMENAWPWIIAALAAHTGWGAYPVLGRYLQTVTLLPSMSLLALGSAVALVALLLVVRPRLQLRLFRTPLMWFFIVVLITRATTNLLATRFTLAIYVQLITLMTPFLVVLISATLLHEKLPPYTGRAIVAATIGALLMMSSDLSQANLGLAFTPEDWLGMGLAFGSSLTLALYMIIVRRSVRHQIPGKSMLLVQLSAILAFSLLASQILGEQWQRWTTMTPFDWLIFGAFSLGVLFGANIGQVGALQHLGAPMVSSLLAWRLVSALVFAALLLDERLTSFWQLLGAFIVLITVTWYLRQQRNNQAPPSAAGL
ncbi:MAG: DMT family transporter [Chloroflexota bacterium]|jgi:drug/metabolite transporter (DMT)-like permease